MISFPEQTINGFIIPAFTIADGDLIFIELGGGSRFMSTVDGIRQALTSEKPFSYVPHIRKKNLRYRFFPMNVGTYLKTYANPQSPFYSKIYETTWIKTKTKIDDIRGSLHRKLLSLYTTLSWTNRIILDVVGMDAINASLLIEQVKQATDNGATAVLIDFATEFKQFATQHIKARPESMGNWTNKENFAAGGLLNIGYAPGTDLLLVLSSQGEGIFDCINGKKIARLLNNEEWWEDFDEKSGKIKGFDCMENIIITTCGMYGDILLPKTTADGWSLEISGPEPDDLPFAKYLVHRIYLVSPDKKHRTFLIKDGPCELRACGFSETGNSFVIASSCDLYIYSRL